MSESASSLINSYVANLETTQTLCFQSAQEELSRRLGNNTNHLGIRTTVQESTTNDANSVPQQNNASPSGTSTTVQGQANNDDATSVDVDTETLTRIEQENYLNNKHIGTKIEHEKDENTFRVYFCNVNGFKLSNDGGEYTEFCMEMEKLQTDVWGVAETNLDSIQHEVRDILHRTNRKHFEYSKMSVGSSNISARRSYYKPGGTMVCAQGRTTSWIIDHGCNRLGRWSYQTLICKNYLKLTIIMAYQVCHQNITTTDQEGNQNVRSYTCSAQQTSMLRQQGRRETPREAFVMDLRAFIQAQEEQQSAVLLLGDFNEVLDDSGERMSSIATTCRLVDLMEEATDTEDIATYVRGQDRIDYALASESVAGALKQGCYEPFKYRNRGDHRAIILDFDEQLLFGNNTHSLASLPAREFTTKDPKAVRQYIAAKHRYLDDHNYATRLEAAKTRWSPQIQEGLDADFQRAGFYAAKCCTKKPRNVMYSNELSQLRRHKNILLKKISSIKLNRSFEAGISRHIFENDELVIPTTLNECQELCKTVQKKIKELTKSAVEKRQTEQQKELRDAVLAGNKKKAHRLKNLMAAERTKAMYAKIRRCHGTEKSGITRLDVPRDPGDTDYKNCTDWISIKTPKEIEERLLQRNQRHLGQANGTFPTVPPFSEKIDWGASTHTADLILDGEWTPEDTDAVSRDVLQHMKARTNLDSITDTITINEWTENIRLWPESTSTSPSGFHLTHSKALVASFNLDEESEEIQQLEQQRHDLIAWQVELLNLAISNKYSMKRWQHIVNVMILKEPNNLKIHRLRVIHLYEQDYNLILAVKWRQLIKDCTNARLLHPQQYGGVPGRDAILPTMLEEFQYEISRASKRPLVHLDYDATACYDRIVMSFGSLASRSFGQHKSIVFINARTLEEAQYYLKTQLGVSEKSYKHCKLFPIYGSGQGAGNSSAIRCVISSILFEAYEKDAHGATFQSPDGTISANVFMIGFVDDTSGSVNAFDLPAPQAPKFYVQRANHDAQRWNDILRVSGGALQDQKCTYHFLYYTFTVEGLAVLQNGEFGPRITVQFTPTTPSRPLQQLSAFNSRKTLGVQKSPASTDRSLLRALSKRNSHHTTTMARSPFTRTDAWSYYHAVYLPSITYPMPSSSLSKARCNTLQRQFKKVLLPKCGYNRTTPNSVVYGSQDFGGIG